MVEHRLKVLLMALVIVVSCRSVEDRVVDDHILSLRTRDDVSILFVVIDTLRADRLGAYGYDRSTSPTLDALAAEGIRFDRTVSQSSWTKTSMASLWSGTYPQANGVLRYDHVLPVTIASAAEHLKRLGFETVGIWRNGWVSEAFGFGRGFDHYFRPPPSARSTALRPSPSAASLIGTDLDTIDSAVEYLRRLRAERFLLYLHLMDVHQYVYDASIADFGASYSDIYDSSIAWVDRCLARLLEALDELSLRDRVLVVVASDHGEGFRADGIEGHARSVYREVTQVPWIMRLPEALQEGVVVEPIVENVDVWPTVLDLLGLPPMEDVAGRSRVPQILGAGAEPDDFAISHLDRTWGRVGIDPFPLVAIVGADERFVYRPKAPMRSELFYTPEDPAERRNLFRARGEEAAELESRAREYLEADAATPGSVPVDRMELRHLRALGYVLEGEGNVEQEVRQEEP